MDFDSERFGNIPLWGKFLKWFGDTSDLDEQLKLFDNFLAESLSLDATSSSISSTGDIMEQQNNLMKIIGKSQHQYIAFKAQPDPIMI